MSDEAVALSPRGIEECRACGSNALASVLDLQLQPLANELLPSADSPSPTFPLHLRICTRCGLGQVGEYVLPDRIFSDYPYLSSVSTSWVAHATAYARRMVDELRLGSSDLVIEVASNDGYLLQQFQALHVRTLGVEPAENVATVARSRGIDTISEFFGEQLARELVRTNGHPRLVVANNVLAHVPDLNDFLAGLRQLCGPDTVVTIENPSFVGLLNQTQFDTIYHEHFSYLTAHAVRMMMNRHGLELVRVEELETHGGSNRYWVVPKTREPDESVAQKIERELAGGLLLPSTWEAFAFRSRATIAGLRTWLNEYAASAGRVAAYGAAAKGNTLLNAVGGTASAIAVVANGSTEKQGRFLPGSRIPVIAPAHLVDVDPSEVLILAWNIAAEIEPLVRNLTPKARVWIAVPEMTELRG